MGLAPIIVEELYGRVAELARQGLSILIVEQFAQAILGVSTVASIMLHGRITRTGLPADIAEELAAAYLGHIRRVPRLTSTRSSMTDVSDQLESPASSSSRPRSISCGCQEAGPTPSGWVASSGPC